MSFCAIDYQGSDCSPCDELLDENIKGIELEIRSDSDYYDILNDLVYDDILICEDNYENRSHRGNMFLETDGSVDYEIKLQADTNKENLKMIKTLNDYGLNPYNIENLSGTSCHIHLNRQYLNNREINQLDIKQAGEFLSEILFEISGRSFNDYSEWARSCLRSNLHDDMLMKAKEIDNRDISSSARYQIVNCNPYNTIELRIFSNYYNFNYDIIKLYMDISDHIIDIAEMMKDKKYVDNIDEIVEWTKDWFTKNSTRRNMYNDKCLESILLTTDKINDKNKIKIQHLLNSFKTASFDDKIQKEMEFFRLLRTLDNNYNIKYNSTIELGNINYDSIIQKFENNL
jgi:hypothetical protein